MFKRLANGLVSGAISLSSLIGCYAPARAEDPPKVTEPVKNLETITDEQINTLMKFETVEEILKEDKVIPAKFEEIKYDKDGKTNYDSVVFQADVKKEERKPTFVFMYLNKDPPHIKCQKTALRDAIAVKEFYRKLELTHPGEVHFAKLPLDEDPLAKKGDYDGLAKKYGIDTFPAVEMYSTFDIIKGETPTKNDGKIKRIDVLAGGPKEDKFIGPLARNMENYWAPTNLFMKKSVDKDDVIARYNNGWELKEVGKSSLLSSR